MNSRASNATDEIAADARKRRFDGLVDVFEVTGPDVSDERFHHLFSYSAYLAAVAARVAYCEFKYGGREMTKGKLLVAPDGLNTGEL